MSALLNDLFSFPIVIYAFPMLLCIMFWVITLIGFVDIEVFDFSTDSELSESGASDGGGWLQSLGLDGVPLTVAITLVDTYALAFTYLAKKYLMPLFDGLASAIAIGSITALVALLLAIPVSAICIKPLRRFFHTHEGERKSDLIGTICTVTTGSVNQGFGQATGDNGMVFSIRAQEPNELAKGSRVVLIEYLPAEDTYQVVSESELMAMSSEHTTI
ncbi:MAG: hypothetical protein ACFHVJ_03115 [Aestuariibacter sp.]